MTCRTVLGISRDVCALCAIHSSHSSCLKLCDGISTICQKRDERQCISAVGLAQSLSCCAPFSRVVATMSLFGDACVLCVSTVPRRLSGVGKSLWTIMVCISSRLAHLSVALCARFGVVLFGGIGVSTCGLVLPSDVKGSTRVALEVGCILGVLAIVRPVVSTIEHSVQRAFMQVIGRAPSPGPLPVSMRFDA